MKPYRCDECGKLYENADLDNDTLLCPSCGGRLQDGILDESTTDSDNVKNAWVCPKCRTRVNEFYLKCNCGYVTSREQVEQNKLDQQDYERVQTATKERVKAEAREKNRLAQQQVREQQRIERLTSLERQKEDNKNQLKKRLAELKVLLDQTILTEEEYNKRRQPLLDKYFKLNERIAREIENIDVSKKTEILSESEILLNTEIYRNDNFLADVEFIEDPPLPTNRSDVAFLEEPSLLTAESSPRSQDSNVATSEQIPKNKSLSWKSFITAIGIAFIINIFAAAASGGKPIRNMWWTVMWIYLSIEAWKYWKWKALLPYPLFVAISVALGLVMVGDNLEKMSWTYIIIKGSLNIGGLILFYLALNRSRKALEQ